MHRYLLHKLRPWQHKLIGCTIHSGGRIAPLRADIFFDSKNFKNLCKIGHLDEALRVVNLLDQQGFCASIDIFYHLLKGCIEKKDLVFGREAHGFIIRSGLRSTAFLGNHLIRMYDLCGSLSEAEQVFSELPEADVFAWTAIIHANVKHGRFERAFNLYHQMHQSSVKPDGHTFVVILKACASTEALMEGKLIHVHINESGFRSNVFVGSALVDMYVKCQSLDGAFTVFEKMPERNVVTWSIIITGLTQHGLCWEALGLFQRMFLEGMEPDQVTYVNILKASAGVMCLAQGKLIHALIIASGFQSDVLVSNSLVYMYTKCGSLKDAHRIFERFSKRDVVTWSALIAGYTQHGCSEESLQLFQQMQFQGVKADRVIFACILKACSSLAALKQGKLVHAHILESGLESDVHIGNTLIDMYAKCGSLEDASSVFNRLPNRATVTWTVMITGYVQHGCGQQALLLFKLMQQMGVWPDRVTVLSTLKACASIPALEYGKLIHADIIESGFESDICVVNTLIDMYTKCGSFENAGRLFDRLQKRDVVTWNAMIASCSECSNYELARQYFLDMQQEGVKPDDGTFLNLLSACNHMGIVDEGYEWFMSMKEDHGIAPAADHCNCMADLFGRVGRVIEAEDVLQSVSSELNVVGWTSLLSHCKIHGNVELGKRCFDRLVTMDCKNSLGYVLMSNIYRNAGMEKDADTVGQLRQFANAWKKPGTAFVDFDKKLNSFFVRDKEHLQIHIINEKLKNLNVQMQEEGYMPCLDLVQQSLLDDEKQDALSW